MKRYGSWELASSDLPDELAFVTIRYPRKADEKFSCKVVGAPGDKHPQLSHRNGAAFSADNLADALGWLKARVTEYTRRGWSVTKLNGRAVEITAANYSAATLDPEPHRHAA